MPAKSEAQQRFFGMVYAYQKGKLPADKVSDRVKRVAKTISPEDARKYAKTSHDDIKEILASIVNSPTYTEQLIREAADSSVPIKVKGRYIDNYTAKLISLTLDNLTENNKLSLLENTIDEIVALSYKIITH
jgi:uncharacterized protein YaaR (DUF327 family)